MEKNTYEKPTTEVVKLELQGVIANGTNNQGQGQGGFDPDDEG